MQKKKGGRPRLDKSELRQIVAFRLTPDEIAQIRERSDSEGYASLSSYLHAKVFSRQFHARNGSLSIANIALIEQMIRQTKAIGNNVNQIAKKIQTFDDIHGKALEYELTKVQNLLKEVIKNQNSVEEVVRETLRNRGYE